MKKGAILGIVQHRGNEDMEKNFNNGYVKESFLIDFIEKIGFKFVEKSNINANLKDTKDYKRGVWTLPPRLVMGEKDKKKYLEIGESDRMTLKFVKIKVIHFIIASMSEAKALIDFYSLKKKLF